MRAGRHPGGAAARGHAGERGSMLRCAVLQCAVLLRDVPRCDSSPGALCLCAVVPTCSSEDSCLCLCSLRGLLSIPAAFHAISTIYPPPPSCCAGDAAAARVRVPGVQAHGVRGARDGGSLDRGAGGGPGHHAHHGPGERAALRDARAALAGGCWAAACARDARRRSAGRLATGLQRATHGRDAVAGLTAGARTGKLPTAPVWELRGCAAGGWSASGDRARSPALGRSNAAQYAARNAAQHSATEPAACLPAAGRPEPASGVDFRAAEPARGRALAPRPGQVLRICHQARGLSGAKERWV